MKTRINQIKLSIFSLIAIIALSFTATNNNLYKFKINSIDGQEISFSDYKGKVIILVNVASNSPQSSQFESLQKLYSTYKDKGVEIIGFPSNSYKNELENDKAIRSFCRSKYLITFPLSTMVDVKGTKQHPIFSYLADKNQNGMMNAPANMDFQKYIINKEGQLAAVFDPTKDVLDNDFISQINGLLDR